MHAKTLGFLGADRAKKVARPYTVPFERLRRGSASFSGPRLSRLASASAPYLPGEVLKGQGLKVWPSSPKRKRVGQGPENLAF